MNNKETAKELLLKADELISKAKELLAKTDDEPGCDTTYDILADWREHISTVDAYTLMIDGDVSSIFHGSHPQYIKDFNPYGTYPTEEYALMAQKIKIFNDKLLAFKWCYDKDYQPDWNNFLEKKYMVTFDSDDERFVVDYNCSFQFNFVYFSSEKIAQKCADWLNLIE